MSDLPGNWTHTHVSQLCTTVRGVTYNKMQSSNEQISGYLPVLRANNIQSGELVFSDLVYVPENCISSHQLIKAGDVVIAMSSGSKSVVGKAANAKSDWIGAFGAFCGVLRPSNEIDTRYFYFFTQSAAYRSRVSELSAGVNINNLKPTHFELIEIPIAPRAEQIRIAQKLDELLAQVDTLKARIDSVPSRLKRFRQSVLKVAISGSLTQAWRDGCPNWRPITIGEICIVSTGKTPKRDIDNYWENGDIPWLTSAVTGEDFCYKAEQFVTKFAQEDCSLKVFQAGTLLMAMYGEGKTRGQVTELKIAATCNQACAAITVDESVAKKEFVKLRLQENYEEIRKQAAGGAQPNLNLNKVREISINLPPLEEQTEIVRRVEQLFAFADQLEAKIASAKSRIDLLTQSILAKAFRGELVPQDPNDEPASVLLERIKAQRAAAPKAKRGRKAATSDDSC